MGTRSKRSKKKNRQYDAVYYLRNKEDRNKDSRKRAASPEQKLYRLLYSRWRHAIKGNKIDSGEGFDKPTKETRLKLIANKELGCKRCGSQEKLELDHKDTYPNNNRLDNLQWLCSVCHKEKTRLDREDDSVYGEYQDLAKKPRFSRE